MSEPSPGRGPKAVEHRSTARLAPSAPAGERRSFMQRLVEFISPGPDSRDELIESLADAEERELIAP